MLKPALSYAWDDCVFGKVNDQYPGDCPRYIDTDNDNICDHSQPAPENRADKELLNKDDLPQTANVALTRNVKDNYHLGAISLITIIFYSLSYLLVRFKKISLRRHRWFWNISLALSFIIMLILGFFLILKTSYKINFSFIANLLFWHVETGIVFALISFFHIFWHRQYYKKSVILNCNVAVLSKFWQKGF